MSEEKEPSVPNIGTCENHPYHVCRCTDLTRQMARDLMFALGLKHDGPDLTGDLIDFEPDAKDGPQ